MTLAVPSVLAWFEHLFAQYGALAVALGAGLEGEAAVTAGGFLAHRGLIDLRLAIVSAFLGSFAVDQLLFLVARFQRERPFIQRARARPAFARALGMIERQPTLFCVVFRFLYGLRIAGPLAVGVSGVPVRRFVILNALSAILWATTFSYLGFRFGAAVTAQVGAFVTGRPLLVAGIILAASVSILLIVRHKALHSHREANPPDP